MLFAGKSGSELSSEKKELIDTSFRRKTVTKQSRRQSAGKTSFVIKKEMDWLRQIKPDIGNYIAGFTDGEGSFNVSVKKRSDYKDQWKLTASFNISQKDRVILALIKQELGCGTLRERKDGVVYYEVTNVTSLKERIIPFFKRFGFLSARKKKNFSIFCSIIEQMGSGEHLTEEGFRKVLELREILNEGKGRKRKYNLSDCIPKEESPETIRKTVSNQ